MKRTTKYQLAYLEEGDIGSSKTEMQRWETVDSQLQSLYEVIGNGILEGWEISASNGLNIVISLGKGHISFVATQTTDNVTLGELTPNSTQYIYASLTGSSYWDKSVSFAAFSSPNDQDDNIYLGKVTTNNNEISGIDTDGRVNLGFINLIQGLIADHRHIGGVGNPPPINLSSEVQGVLNQGNLPDMDASLIKTGTLDANRLPEIDHITKLINQGTLTHAQLDAFVEALDISGNTLMGETSTIDLLQLILALKHVYPGIDEYLVNEIALIPGISPDSYIDFENTTAIVDTNISSEGGTHTIYGVPTAGQEVFTKTWDTEAEFNAGTTSDVIVDGDTVSLDTREAKLVIDEFNDVNEWQVVTADSSSTTVTLDADTTSYFVAPQSGKLTVGDTTVGIALEIKREFDAQDWSEYDFLVVYLKTESVQHGDLYFYLKDNIDGFQNSYTKVLDRNAPTINLDTLQNGWQEVTVDMSSFTRDNINEIGFYVSTQKGWDTSKGFDFNVDNIYLTSGNKFKDNGYVREIFGGDYPYNFWRVRWDALIPSDAQSIGLELKMRTRVGNTLADLSTASWSAYQSDSTGSIISLPADTLYKYIEVEMYFVASTDTSRSAWLRKIFLDFITGDTDNSFNYDTQDDWQGGTLFNVDTQTQPGSMLISGTDEIDNIYYGTEGSASQLDGELAKLYKVTGSVLPRSTYQVQNNIQPSLGLVTGVARGSNGSMWLSDSTNDRLVELNKYGALVRGFYGSFLVPPTDNYGVEDSGPGSNIIEANGASESTTTTTTVSGVGATEISVLQAIYNSDASTLYVVFDKDLDNVFGENSTFDIDKFYIKVGANRIYLTDSDVELLGIDESKYNNWYPLMGGGSEAAKFIDQFKFTSHVIKITLKGAEKATLNSMVNVNAPSIVIYNPYEQQRTGRTVKLRFSLYNFVLGTGVGGNGIQVTIDSGIPQNIYVDNMALSVLEDGVHTVKAQLLNADGTLNTNVEAIAESTFVVYLGTYASPYISIQTPRPNQVYSASPIMVDFTVENFAIVSAGQHLRYQLDSSAVVDYYTTDSIQLSDIDAGAHTITLWLVDERGINLGYTYGSVNVDFNVGLNSNAVAKLYVDRNGIYDTTKMLTNDYVRQNLDVANVYFSNMYCPIDVQVIPAETSVINPSGLPTVLVAKLRSQSSTYGLGGEEAVAEIVIRTTGAAAETTATLAGTTTTTTTTLIATEDLIFGTNYLDGHSVVQLDMSANTLMSNNAAVFALDKTSAWSLLGSAEKLGSDEILIGDSYNKRAIITYTDLDTEKPLIEWEYNSDRYIPDFHIVLQDDVTVNVNDSSLSEASVFIRQGSIVIWENNSASPVRVLSGTTDFDTFQQDPDLTLYGDVFESPVLQPGERYSFKFVSVGQINYFTYPDILTASINVTRNRISSRDQFIVLESDNLESPFSSRVIKVNSWGGIVWSFGEGGYLVKPRDARPLSSGGVLIST